MNSLLAIGPLSLCQAARLIDLHTIGFVVWSGSGETAVRFSSYRFRVTGAEFKPTSLRTEIIPAKSPAGVKNHALPVGTHVELIRPRE